MSIYGLANFSHAEIKIVTQKSTYIIIIPTGNYTIAKFFTFINQQLKDVKCDAIQFIFDDNENKFQGAYKLEVFEDCKIMSSKIFANILGMIELNQISYPPNITQGINFNIL